MAKVTSKYQVTVSKAIADQYGIRPGDEIDWVPAGDVIRVVPSNKPAEPGDRESRLHLYGQPTGRHQRPPRPTAKRPRNRGWRSEDLYTRGRCR